MAVAGPVVKVVVPFVVGIIAAPFAKPVLRKAARASIGAGLRARVLVAEVVSDYQDIAAEAKEKQSSKLAKVS
jgi:hypothetical protein